MEKAVVGAHVCTAVYDFEKVGFSGNHGIACVFRCLAHLHTRKVSTFIRKIGSNAVIDLLSAAYHSMLGDLEMGRTKYATALPETYMRGSQVRHKGTSPGAKTAADKLALLCPQAETVIRKFGGARELARVIKEMAPERALNPSSIYRWMHPREVGGSGGEIPVRHIKLIMKAARFAGIMLKTEDLYPHAIDTKQE